MASWANTRETLALISTAEEIQDMVRFNEAIDQAQTESMARYTKLLRDAQSLFLAILGHDVRSPLGAVSMGAQVLLQDQTLPAKVLKVALRIFNSAKRVDAIVRDLLDFSTSHLGDGIPIDPYTVDLAEITHNVVDEVRTFHPDRKIKLECTGELIGAFDGPRLAQAFSNLISNAVHHGKEEGEICVAISGSDQGVVFEVTNDADVIEPAKLRALFDPVKSFAIRPPDERSQYRVQNLGLGLYVVREIVRAHEGEISVSSTQETGVNFLVSLPRLTTIFARTCLLKSAIKVFDLDGVGRRTVTAEIELDVPSHERIFNTCRKCATFAHHACRDRKVIRTADFKMRRLGEFPLRNCGTADFWVSR